MNTALAPLFQMLSHFDEQEIQLALGKFIPKTLKKKTILLKEGETAKEVYYLLQGMMRLYYEKDGVDISAYFFTENMFAGAYDSFSFQRPSSHYIEALEECEVLAISYPDLQQLYLEVPKMNELVRKILEERFFALHQLFTSQILDSPEERYLNLLNDNPELLERVPQHHIATFLGVTPVSLSRIRNRSAKKMMKQG
jgi:CRP-like cAMP-binding protein